MDPELKMNTERESLLELAMEISLTSLGKGNDDVVPLYIYIYILFLLRFFLFYFNSKFIKKKKSKMTSFQVYLTAALTEL